MQKYHGIKQYEKYKKHHEKISQKTNPEMINTKDGDFMGVVVSAKLHMSGADNPQKATPILRLCHGVFTDRFIFRHILGQFFCAKIKSLPRLLTRSKYKISK